MNRRNRKLLGDKQKKPIQVPNELTSRLMDVNEVSEILDRLHDESRESKEFEENQQK